MPLTVADGSDKMAAVAAAGAAGTGSGPGETGEAATVERNGFGEVVVASSVKEDKGWATLTSSLPLCP